MSRTNVMEATETCSVQSRRWAITRLCDSNDRLNASVIASEDLSTTGRWPPALQPAASRSTCTIHGSVVSGSASWNVHVYAYTPVRPAALFQLPQPLLPVCQFVHLQP